MSGWLEVGAGAVVVAGTTVSLVSTLVLPRRGQRSALEQSHLAGDPQAVRARRWPRVVSSRLATAVWHLSLGFFLGITAAATGICSLLRRGRPQPEELNGLRHRMLWALGPVSLFLLFALWLGLFLVGYGLVFWPILGAGFGAGMRMSVSSIFTLGFDAPAGRGATLVASLEAATGILSAALEVSYLFTLYARYSSREQLVRKLESRAGYPALGPELIRRELEVQALGMIGDLYADWEAWAVEVTEAHLSYPWLLLFRSADPMQSWVTSLLAVLDSAATYLALADVEGTAAGVQARHCLRMGFTAFREVALVFGIPVDFDPRPEDALQLPREEFVGWAQRLAEHGFPVVGSFDDGWRAFRGWRVNYETIAYALVEKTHAVPGQWTGAAHPIAVRPTPHRRSRAV